MHNTCQCRQELGSQKGKAVVGTVEVLTKYQFGHLKFLQKDSNESMAQTSASFPVLTFFCCYESLFCRDSLSCCAFCFYYHVILAIISFVSRQILRHLPCYWDWLRGYPAWGRRIKFHRRGGPWKGIDIVGRSSLNRRAASVGNVRFSKPLWVLDAWCYVKIDEWKVYLEWIYNRASQDLRAFFLRWCKDYNELALYKIRAYIISLTGPVSILEDGLLEYYFEINSTEQASSWTWEPYALRLRQNIIADEIPTYFPFIATTFVVWKAKSGCLTVFKC